MFASFIGQSSLSAFRLEKFKQQLADQLGTPLEVQVFNVYLLKYASEPNDAQVAQLKAYIDDDVRYLPEQQESQLSYYVVPRIGTRSPWSTKATDIAHHCDLNFVEHIEQGRVWSISSQDGSAIDQHGDFIATQLFDPLTQSLFLKTEQLAQIYTQSQPKELHTIDLINGGMSALNAIDQQLQLAISEQEKQYLCDAYKALNRNPSDAELMMFSQVNSEHCRHKIFNAEFEIDGVKKPLSLFSMIRHTHKTTPQHTIVAYKDNASVIEGSHAKRYFANEQHIYQNHEEAVHILTKVETHNHPTAISPFPGAATGSGGEIRDEGATGRGSRPKAAMNGFSVSNLHLPDAKMPWEGEPHKPDNIASALQIMLDGPIGAAAYNNEFGRPNILGYFRTLEQEYNHTQFGYHKPIMIAGGLGNIREQHVEKNSLPEGTRLVVLGGPAMLIGLGGGAASSVGSGQGSEEFDFASVQRGNPEMQHRAQEVIDRCWAMGEHNPILSIHDVGAGGLSNALPEIIHDAGKGGVIELRDILCDDIAMSPMEIWCNESQERYVLAIAADQISMFESMCQRERCLYCVVGSVTDATQLIVNDRFFEKTQAPIELPMDVLFGKTPQLQRSDKTQLIKFQENDIQLDLKESLYRVLKLPSVADKSFLITIGDRSVGGLVTRDQMVGPWQVPVADVGVTLSDFYGKTGEAMSMGERTPIAMGDAPASGRMAIAEAITNISASYIGEIERIKLSANWMASAGTPGQDSALYRTVETIAMDVCSKIGLSIPVGKDSMSMRTRWQDKEGEHTVISPVSLIISAFAPVKDVSKTLTPELNKDIDSTILLIDLGQARLGLSALAQVSQQDFGAPADLDNPQQLAQFYRAIQALHQKELLHSYHDRSDGGMITSLLEMAFASRCGLDIKLKTDNPQAQLFNEEVGALIQIKRSDLNAVKDVMAAHQLDQHCMEVASISDDQLIRVYKNDQLILQESRVELQKAWSFTSWQIQRMRDNPTSADQEYARIDDLDDPGLHAKLSFDLAKIDKTFMVNTTVRPKIAILREQGTNGQIEMAMAFDKAGFESYDVHMSDLIDGRFDLKWFNGMAACGGFSFGDVLGAGRGWAKSILFNPQLKQMFAEFFNNKEKFALGVCNGCQMMSEIQSIIPGSDHWPAFTRNQSEQYEARQIMVEVAHSESLLLKNMAGSRIPIVIGHGEGRVKTIHEQFNQSQVALRFVDNRGAISENYPPNPNGSVDGITGITNADGRVTIMMPHPERVVRSFNHSWHPKEWGEHSPWLAMFQNARQWLK